jgi:6-phosphogluconolactonase
MHLPGATTDILPDAAAVAATAAQRILHSGRAALAARGRCHLVLAGGTTPAAAYRHLAQSGQDWTGWRFYFGDERCLPATDPQRNSRMACDAWLDPVGIAPEHILAIPADLGPEEAARRYEPVIAAARPFDLVLLGMGEDGHTASLFPGQDFPEQRLVMPVFAAPKPPPERVSLTPQALGHAHQVLILVTGRGKHQALLDWQSGAPLPIAQVAARGNARVLLDQEAAGR